MRFAEGFRVTRLLFRRRFAWRTFKTIHEGKSRRLVVLWRTPVCVLPTRAARFAALRSSRFLSALSRPVVSSGPIDLRMLLGILSLALLPRKEVIQPHLPIRLPCYDFTPVIGLTFDSWLLSVTSLASGAPNSHGVTGGVYKARERIHRGMLIRDY